MRRKRRQKATKKMDKMQLSKNFSFGSTWSNLVVPVWFSSQTIFFI